MHLLADLADASTEATLALGAYVAVARHRRRAPRPKRRSGLAATDSNASSNSMKDSRCPANGCSPSRSENWRKTQDAFRSIAGRARRRRSARRVAQGQGRPSGAGHAHRDGAGPIERAADLPRAQRRSSTSRRATTCAVASTPEFLPLDVGQPVDARSRSRSRPTAATYYLTDALAILAARKASRAPPRVEPARRCGASRCTRSSRVTSCTPNTSAGPNPRYAARSCLRRGLVRRGLGALRRADDDRGRIRPPEPRRAARATRRLTRAIWPGSSSASSCTPRTGRSSKASASSRTRRFSTRCTRGGKRSAARSTRVMSCTPPGS